jgi:hypothetical protein
MIKAYCKRAQYVVISHNDVVIAKADTSIWSINGSGWNEQCCEFEDITIIFFI